MKKHFLLFYILLLVFQSPCFAQSKKEQEKINKALSKIFPKHTTDTISIRNFKSGLDLQFLWKYKVGDDRSYASKDYDDSGWRKLKLDTGESDTLLKTYKALPGLGQRS